MNRRRGLAASLFWMVCLATALPWISHAGETLECESLEYSGATYDVIRVDPARTRIELYWKDGEGERFQNFARLKNHLELEGKRLLFATNSGIYAEGYTPLGLHIEKGTLLRKLNRGKAGAGNFSMKPNGVFFVDKGKARVLETEEFNELGVKPELAVQSGPLLVQRGELHPRFREGSESLNIRNGVGVDPEGQVVFAITGKPVNFHAFATFFRDRLECSDALYLDGTLSGMYAPCLGREDFGLDYVGILAVVEEAKP